MTAHAEDGTTWIMRLSKAVGSGEFVDLPQDLTEGEFGQAAAGEMLSLRQLPADDIRAVLLEPALVTDPRGLQIRGAFVTGTLDLDNANPSPEPTPQELAAK